MNPTIKNAKKIVLIDLLYLGDLIFATPMFKNLRRLYPNARIDLIMNNAFYELMKDNPYFDHVYPYRKNFSLKESLVFAEKLRKNGYDLGLNIHGSWRSIIILKIISPEFTVGLGEGFKKLFMNKAIKTLTGRHMVEVYLEFLKKIGFPLQEKSAPELHIPVQARERIHDFIRGHNLESFKLIGLNTGGSWLTKQWTTEGFAKLADELQTKYKNVRVVFLGGTNDLPRVQAITNLMTTIPVIATGKTSLPELAALLSRCALVISGDSGPIHVAAAVGTTTIALFGPSDEEKYRPFGKRHMVLTSSVPCRPCGKHKCPHDHHKCMKDLNFRTVLKQAETVLDTELKP